MLCASLVLALFAAGCFSPQVKNGGFTCVATDDPPCPNGYFCVNGFCVDNPAAMVGGDDLSTGDMSLPVNDFAAGPDMAHGSMADLSSTTGDMAQGGACGMSGDQCITQSCCPGSTCVVFACI
jgi:hypothetical protein